MNPETPEEVAAATTPDAISVGALNEIDLLDGEQILRCWHLTHGYLVMTNLRCLEIRRAWELLSEPVWNAGPSVFFFDMAPPTLIAGRLLEVRSVGDTPGPVLRALLADPRSALADIAEEMPAGRAEWQRRRAAGEAAVGGRATRAAVGPVVREVVREVIKVRCSYCGNLMDEGADRCPSCGAPQH